MCNKIKSRFWRKTRKPITGCKHIGTDCNRNFDFHWSSACDRASRYTFRGVKPFSEPETTILQSIMHSLKADCKFYLTLHAYAQAFMYPWGFSKLVIFNFHFNDSVDYFVFRLELFHQTGWTSIDLLRWVTAPSERKLVSSIDAARWLL